jgi:methylated-DNA-protein-cysteine methyltransferase related protein
LAITSAIPSGRITTFLAIGEHLDVMPRHVAYILATLNEPLASVVPWHRVLPASGKLIASKHVAQMNSLDAEGVHFSTSGEIADFSEKYIAAGTVKSGVPKRYRDQAGLLAG